MTEPQTTRRERVGTTRSRMADVARLAGVSTATVSRAIRQPEIVSPAVRGRIQQAIERLSYRRNLMAGALASASSMTIGVIIPSIINSFFAATVEALEEELAGSGYQLMLGNSNYSSDTEQQLITSFLAWSPAAMVVTGRRHNRDAVRTLLDSGIPVVEMWELSDNPIDTIVGFSHRAVAHLAVEHFSQRGARRLGFIGAYMDRDYRTVDRHAGFVEAALQAGYAPPAEIRLPDRASAVGGAKALREMLDQNPEVDAIFCSNDIIALGALFEAQRLKLGVPDRLKLCGFGDLEFAAASNPSLTTVRPPRREIGIKIAQLLRARLGGTPDPGGSFDLGVELVVRGST
jgi:LacI family transcriptional regulator, gluconate utilization system Gnt-I transcriptional repressor